MILTGCHKKEYLATQSSSNVFEPTSAEDLQGLLDNQIFGYGPYLNTILSDEFYYTNALYNSLGSEARVHTWQDNIFDATEAVPDWDGPFNQVYYCNMALEGVAKLTVTNTNQTQLDLVEGDGLFKRAIAVYNIAQLFARPYNAATAKMDLGIPLRLTTDSKEKLSRGTVQATYDKIIADLVTAIPLLPVRPNPKFRNRGSQPAAWAMLARVHLSMGNYKDAATSADTCLKLYDSLIDYNDIDITAPFPFGTLNKETLYQSKVPARNYPLALWYGTALIEPRLLQLYQPGDLRQYIFFNKSAPYLKGSYSGEILPFNGIALDEVYLVLAESYVKTGELNKGINILNKLLATRWLKGQYTPYTSVSAESAWLAILEERQKELPFRNIRWTDIRRLNTAGLQIDLLRNVAGTRYTISHTETDKFVLPLPGNVLTYGYPQNPR